MEYCILCFPLLGLFFFKGCPDLIGGACEGAIEFGDSPVARFDSFEPTSHKRLVSHFDVSDGRGKTFPLTLRQISSKEQLEVVDCVDHLLECWVHSESRRGGLIY
jgi:hypothetical protein